jgi:acyl-CoA synthetase (AMP-forming)/AMP-acid ligase II
MTTNPSTLPELVAEAARTCGDEPWLIEPDADGETTSFATLEWRVARMARLLDHQGVGPGDTVAISLGNSWRFMVAWFATNWVGATIVPLNTALTGQEATFILAHSGAKLWIVDRDIEDVDRCVAEAEASSPVLAIDDLVAELDSVEPLPRAQVDTSATASLLYTSGTTASPKGCACSHHYYIVTGLRYCGLIEASKADRLSTSMPLFHAGAQISSTVGSLLSGIPLILQRRFSASRFFEQLAATNATIFNYIGAIPAILFARPEAASDSQHKLRAAWGGGTPRDIHDQFEKRFHVTMLESYGSTELGATIATPLRSDRHVGTSCCGVLYPGPDPYPPPEVVLVDIDTGGRIEGAGSGELLVRDEAMFSGYYAGGGKVESALDSDGWFHTGDVLRRDADNTYYFVERANDRIRRAGENMSPSEIERVIARHPAVLQVAVVGLPDPILGDVPFAFVQVKDGHEASRVLAEELLERCRAELAYFKVPTDLRFVDEFPHTSTQRIQKRKLVEMAQQTPGR